MNRPMISVTASDKGGVGKTTMTANMAIIIASRGYKTLLVDLDENNNLTSFFSSQELVSRMAEYNAMTLLVGDHDLGEVAFPTNYENLDIVPATKALKRSNKELDGNLAALLAFMEEFLTADYDFILIDTHPGDKVELQGALGTADVILIPIKPAGWEIQGYMTVIEQVNKARVLKKTTPKILGVPYFTSEKGYENLTGMEEVPVSLSYIPRESSMDMKNTFNKPVRPGTKMYSHFESLVDEMIDAAAKSSRELATEGV